MTNIPETLIITRRDIQRLMCPSDFMDAVELGFRAGAMGKANSPHPLHLRGDHGGFHAKGASISLGRDYVAVKVNGNFPDNPAKHSLPTIQGAIILSDASNGRLLAIIDSIEVTLRRTAAASALAATLLAKPNSSTLLICGCGEQGRAHWDALREILPINHCILWDRELQSAQAFAEEFGGIAVVDLNVAARSADIIACCTSSRQPYLELEIVKPGSFIAAVGADHPDKSEISPALMAAATVVTDVTSQCAEMGDLHHSMVADCMSAADVHAELGQLLAGAKAGRSSPEEIIIFDSTGTGLQDVAASAAIYERCLSDRSIRSVALSSA